MFLLLGGICTRTGLGGGALKMCTCERVFSAKCFHLCGGGNGKRWQRLFGGFSTFMVCALCAKTPPDTQADVDGHKPRADAVALLAAACVRVCLFVAGRSLCVFVCLSEGGVC